MIVRLDHLQALQCDVCEKIYELPRHRGFERDLNGLIDFTKRLEVRHSKCVPKDDMPPAMVVVQSGANARVS